MTLRKAEKTFKVLMRNIKNKVDKVHMQEPGRPRILTDTEEKNLVAYAKLGADWGQPMSKIELRMIAKNSLKLEGRKISFLQQKDNLPGEDWALSFIERHKDEQKLKNGGNIKASRAAVCEDTVAIFFENLKKTVEGVSSKAIINYDETNLADNPGQSKFVYERTTKYPERIFNFSKGSTSIMMAETASGCLFPPYVIYKAQNLWTPWVKNGTKMHNITHQKVDDQMPHASTIVFLPQLFLTAGSLMLFFYHNCSLLQEA